jgi:uncharacterized protein
MTGQPLPARIATIDVVRGVAVLGILLMNIVSFGLPGAAYDDPTIWGGWSAWDYRAWNATFVLADGKMRGLFTLLFGASLMIVAGRAEAAGLSAARIHYRRMAVLLPIGLIHAYLVWYGDILVEYAIAGMLLYPAWRWRTSALFYAAGLLIAASILIALSDWAGMAALRYAATAPGASASDVSQWLSFNEVDMAPVWADLAGYGGGIAAVFAARVDDAVALQGDIPVFLIDSCGLMLLGMALLRAGYFTRWPRWRHLTLIAIGLGIALPLMIPVASGLIVSAGEPGLAPVEDRFGRLVSLLLRPWIMLAYASATILIVRSGMLPRLCARLAAAGRMALSNYLATSLICTTIFYGTGFGLYGSLGRAQLYLVVPPVWAAMLLWSPWWLGRFAYGPAEWAWRSLARGKIQQLRRIDVET